MQNEMLMVMSLKVLREIVFKIHKASLWLMKPQIASIPKQEFLVIQWVDEHLIVHEEL